MEKTCPVCKAKAFDDATQCFGCLHSFTEGDATRNGSELDDQEVSRIRLTGELSPEFSIRFKPEVDAAGMLVWKCAVEA